MKSRNERPFGRPSHLISFLALSSVLTLACAGEDRDGAAPSEGGDGDGDGEVPLPGDGDDETPITGDGDGVQEPLVDPCGEYLVNLNDVNDNPGTVEFVATELADIVRYMVGRGNTLYFISGDGLYSLVDEETEPTLIGEGLPSIYGGGLTDGRGPLRVDETHAYYLTDTGIARTSLLDGVTEAIFDELGEDQITTDIALSDGRVYFGIYFSGSYENGIYSIPLAGGEAPRYETSLSPIGMTVKDGTIYGADGNDSIFTVTGGGDPLFLTDFTNSIFPHVGDMQFVGDVFYWRDSARVYSCTPPDCDTPTIHTEGGASDGFLVSGNRIIHATDSLGWTSLDGSECGNLVLGDIFNQAKDFAVTDGHVYVDGGTLFRLPMP